MPILPATQLFNDISFVDFVHVIPIYLLNYQVMSPEVQAEQMRLTFLK
jgi:hypothetical protein